MKKEIKKMARVSPFYTNLKKFPIFTLIDLMILIFPQTMSSSDCWVSKFICLGSRRANEYSIKGWCCVSTHYSCNRNFFFFFFFNFHSPPKKCLFFGRGIEFVVVLLYIKKRSKKLKSRFILFRRFEREIVLCKG